MAQKITKPAAATGKTTAKNAPPPPKSKKKLWLIVSGAVILLIGGVTAAILWYKPTPPDPKMSPESAKKFMASKDFQRLNGPEKIAYVSSFGDDRSFFRPGDDMTDAQKAQLRDKMRALFEARTAEQMKKFFAASKEEQNKMLDEDIKRDAEREKQMQQRRNQAGGQGGGPGGQGGQPRQQPTAQQRREREVSSNPATRAQMQVYNILKRQRQNGQR